MPIEPSTEKMFRVARRAVPAMVGSPRDCA